METLVVHFIAFDIFWEAPKKNLLFLEKEIEKIPKNTDILILPEMFTSGFTTCTKIAETMNGETIKWLKNIANSKNIAIIGSIPIKENNNYYNRLLFVHPNQTIETYDKRHLFSLGNENKNYTAGQEKIIITYKGWKITPFICYDLRFPVWSRNNGAYDVLIYIANWPKSRISHWKTLLKARAIENQSYTIGVNRIGTDGNNIKYNGKSAVYDSFGKKIDKNNTAFLYKQHLIETRNKFPFLQDRDDFLITNRIT